MIMGRNMTKALGRAVKKVMKSRGEIAAEASLRRKRILATRGLTALQSQ